MIEDIGQAIPQVTVAWFQEKVLPPLQSHPELSAVINQLKANGDITTEGDWKVFPKQPALSKSTESQIQAYLKKDDTGLTEYEKKIYRERIHSCLTHMNQENADLTTIACTRQPSVLSWVTMIEFSPDSMPGSWLNECHRQDLWFIDIQQRHVYGRPLLRKSSLTHLMVLRLTERLSYSLVQFRVSSDQLDAWGLV